MDTSVDISGTQCLGGETNRPVCLGDLQSNRKWLLVTNTVLKYTLVHQYSAQAHSGTLKYTLVHS